MCIRDRSKARHVGAASVRVRLRRAEPSTAPHARTVLEGAALLRSPERVRGESVLSHNVRDAILVVHEVKPQPQGKKDDFKRQVEALIQSKASGGVAVASVVEEMLRRTAAAAATRLVNDCPLALPAPAQVLALPAPAHPTPTQAQEA
eukprot:328201-Prymnesium_polylepis.2